MQKSIIGMVLAGGRVEELSVLTATRPKSALSMWGMYRIIDFVLSNMMHSGIQVVGVLAQYRPYPLSAHIGGGEPWDYIGRHRKLRLLSPFLGADDSDWYKGTADSLYQNINFLTRFRPELVLVASGDHIYSMDYRPLIKQHLATGADLTMALKKVPLDQAQKYGTAKLDKDGRVVDYREKSSTPAGDLASLTIYLFNFETLVKRLRQNAAEGTHHQVYSEIIPRMVRENAKVFGYVFDGYWQYARTIDSYYLANMDILGPQAPDLESWQVRTNLEFDEPGDPPPALFRESARVDRSFICSNVEVAGTVEDSILSPGTRVEKGAAVKNSIIMYGGVIKSGARVENSILDKGVIVGERANLGVQVGPDIPNASKPETLSMGVTVVGKNTAIPAGISIGKNCIICNGVKAADFNSSTIPSGSTIVPAVNR